MPLRLPFWHAAFDEVGYPRPWILPSFPYTHTEPVSVLSRFTFRKSLPSINFDMLSSMRPAARSLLQNIMQSSAYRTKGWPRFVSSLSSSLSMILLNIGESIWVSKSPSTFGTSTRLFSAIPMQVCTPCVHRDSVPVSAWQPFLVVCISSFCHLIYDLLPFMWFLSVRPDVCLGLPSDSASRRTPLPPAVRFPL